QPALWCRLHAQKRGEERRWRLLSAQFRSACPDNALPGFFPTVPEHAQPVPRSHSGILQAVSEPLFDLPDTRLPHLRSSDKLSHAEQSPPAPARHRPDPPPCRSSIPAPDEHGFVPPSYV